MNKQMITLYLCLLILLGATASLAQTAQEITAQCVVRNQAGSLLKSVTDGSYESAWICSSTDRLLISSEHGERIAGLYLQFSNATCPFEVQTQDENGKWKSIYTSEAPFLTEYVTLEEAGDVVRLLPMRGKGSVRLAEVHVFGEGDVPGWVQRWMPPHEKADLLLISAHPDDEVLFMGGTIPYYAAERGMNVQVAYLVPATPYRKLELLDGLWLCGVRHYPDIGTFPDVFSTNLNEMYKHDAWNRQRVLRYMTGLYRRYRPEVVLTHDVNGEYGHGAHRVAADAAQQAVALAADVGYQHKKLAQTQPWQIKKLYLHLYDQGRIRMDWRVPLEVFDGRTAFDMAEAAFECHTSQQDTVYRVEDFGPYDNAEFGLAYSAVGEDVEKNDFFEHIE